MRRGVSGRSPARPGRPAGARAGIAWVVLLLAGGMGWAEDRVGGAVATAVSAFEEQYSLFRQASQFPVKEARHALQGTQRIWHLTVDERSHQGTRDLLGQRAAVLHFVAGSGGSKAGLPIVVGGVGAVDDALGTVSIEVTDWGIPPQSGDMLLVARKDPCEALAGAADEVAKKCQTVTSERWREALVLWQAYRDTTGKVGDICLGSGSAGEALAKCRKSLQKNSIRLGDELLQRAEKVIQKAMDELGSTGLRLPSQRVQEMEPLVRPVHEFFAALAGELSPELVTRQTALEVRWSKLVGPGGLLEEIRKRLANLRQQWFADAVAQDAAGTELGAASRQLEALGTDLRQDSDRGTSDQLKQEIDVFTVHLALARRVGEVKRAWTTLGARAETAVTVSAVSTELLSHRGQLGGAEFLPRIAKLEAEVAALSLNLNCAQSIEADAVALKIPERYESEALKQRELEKVRDLEGRNTVPATGSQGFSVKWAKELELLGAKIRATSSTPPPQDGGKVLADLLAAGKPASNLLLAALSLLGESGTEATLQQVLQQKGWQDVQILTLVRVLVLGTDHTALAAVDYVSPSSPAEQIEPRLTGVLDADRIWFRLLPWRLHVKLSRAETEERASNKPTLLSLVLVPPAKPGDAPYYLGQYELSCGEYKPCLAYLQANLAKGSDGARLAQMQQHTDRVMSAVKDEPADGMRRTYAVAYCEWLNQQVLGLAAQRAATVGKSQPVGMEPPRGAKAGAAPSAPAAAVRLGFRLPTEAEWLHACLYGTRAGPDPLFADGAYFGQARGTRPMGRSEANTSMASPLGLHSMRGNLAEIVGDVEVRNSNSEFGKEVTYSIVMGGDLSRTEEECKSNGRWREALLEADTDDSASRYRYVGCRVLLVTLCR